MLEESSQGRTKEKIDSFRRRFEEPIVRKIRNKKLRLEDVEAYLYARHAKERNRVIAGRNPKFEEGGGSGMFNEEADVILANLANRDLIPALQSIEQDVRGIRDSYLDLLVDTGLERPETTQLWRDTYKNYIPLKGRNTVKGAAENLMDKIKSFAKDPKAEALKLLEATKNKVKFAPQQEEFGRNLGGGRFVVKGPNSQIAFGRQSRATNLLGNLMAQYEDAIIKSERNKIGNAFLQLVRMFPDKEVWQIRKAKMRPKLNDQGEIAFGKLTQINPERAFTTKVEGDEVTIEINDPILAGQLNGITQPRLGKFVTGIAKVSRTLAALNTQWNPFFIFSNFQRDIFTAAINTAGLKEGGFIASAKVVAKVFRSVPEIFVAMSTQSDSLAGRFLKQLPGIKGNVTKWQARFKEFSEAGGQTSFIDFIDIETRAQRIESLIDQGLLKASFLEFGTIISDMNSAVEMASRMSLFDTLRNNGVNAVRAASAAKNVTVNFNKRGEFGVALNALYMFSNAGIQGGTILLRTLNPRNPNAKKATILVGTMVATGFGLAMLNRVMGGKDPEDDEFYYDKLPDWVKDNQMVLFYGPGKFIKLWRLPYGYNIFHVMGDATYDSLMAEKGITKPMMRIGSSIIDSFNPLGTSEASLAQIATPTLLRPIQQINGNETFYGGPIMPAKQRFGIKLPDHQRFFGSVSDVSKYLTANLAELERKTGFEVFDISPETIDHVFAYYTGGLGKNIRDAISSFYKQAKFERGVDLEPQIRERPFQRLIMGEVLPSQDRTTYFETIDQIQADKLQFENLKKHFGVDAALQFKRKDERNRLNLSLITLANVKKSRRIYSKFSKKINKMKIVNDRIRAKQEGFAKYFDLAIDNKVFRDNLKRMEALNKRKNTEAKKFNAFYKKRKGLIK